MHEVAHVHSPHPLERFAAIVDVGATAELNPCHALVRGSDAIEAEAMRDCPS